MTLIFLDDFECRVCRFTYRLGLRSAGKRLRCHLTEAIRSASMHLAKRVITPWGVVAFTAMAILTYIFWKGPERFYYESFGTWIVSPGIYVRLLPVPLNQWLLTGLRDIPLLASALHLVPLALLSLSFALSLYSIWNKTVVHAFISLGLAAAVFSAYHFLQPFGITLIHY